MNSRQKIALFLILLVAGLTACNMPARVPPTPTATATSAPTPTPTSPPPVTLRVWLPPIAGIPADSPAAEMLIKRINAFAAERGLKAEIRVKPLFGAAGMLTELGAARAVAPSAVPDVVLMPRALMEEAVANGLVFPLPEDAFTAPLSTGDWFGYAQQMAAVQSVAYGVPFAGDAFGLAYNPNSTQPVPKTWDDWINADQPLRIALGDKQATAVLALYQAAGGAWQSKDSAPTLDENTLAQVFALIQTAYSSGLLDQTALRIESDDDLWKRYRGEASGFMLTHISHLLAVPEPRRMAPIPAVDANHRVVVSTAWLWTLTTPDSERQRLGVALLAYLGAPEFVARWTDAAGFLPPRRSELDAWGKAPHRDLAMAVIPFMAPPPPYQIKKMYGAALAEAVARVVNGKRTPQEAAQWAIASAAKP